MGIFNTNLVLSIVLTIMVYSVYTPIWCICHGYFVKYDNYIYSPANIYNVHAISQYMKLTLWHHTINTALALDKFLIKAPPPHAH